jgi:DNA mismatch repair ATPase MutS
VPLFDEIAWLGIGARAAGGDEEPLLSAFGNEIEEVRALLARAPQRPLVLIDEFARTTSPPEGRALLIALLEILGKRGALALAATHLPGVARAARAAHYASGRLRSIPAPSSPVRLDEALVRLGEAMEYGLTRADEADAAVSDAIALAEILGLEAALTERARDVLRDEDGPPKKTRGTGIADTGPSPRGGATSGSSPPVVYFVYRPLTSELSDPG